MLPRLDDKEGRVRVGAVLLLTDLSLVDGGFVVSAFVKAILRTALARITLTMAWAVRRRQGKYVVPTLEAALEDLSHYILGAHGCLLVRQSGPRGSKAVAALTAALADDKDLVRTAAQEALRKIRE